MIKFKKAIAMLLAGGLIMGSFYGCADSNSSSSGGTSGTSDQENSTSLETGEKAKLLYSQRELWLMKR